MRELDPDAPAFATVDEAARYLHLSRSMIHKLLKNEKIPSTTWGRAIRIPWSFLERLAETGMEGK